MPIWKKACSHPVYFTRCRLRAQVYRKAFGGQIGTQCLNKLCFVALLGLEQWWVSHEYLDVQRLFVDTRFPDIVHLPWIRRSFGNENNDIFYSMFAGWIFPKCHDCSMPHKGSITDDSLLRISSITAALLFLPCRKAERTPDVLHLWHSRAHSGSLTLAPIVWMPEGLQCRKHKSGASMGTCT